MKIRIIVLAITIISFMLDSCRDKSSEPMTDVVPSTVTIGSQVWMSRNLDVDRYRNGDIIPQIKNQAEWEELTTGAWRYYNNDPALGAVYGKLYNWYAVTDPRGLAPDGWHVASENEWKQMINYLGGENVAGAKLKSTGTIKAGNGLWAEPNTGATNETGFSALPGGYCYYDGRFFSKGYVSHWWVYSIYDYNISGIARVLLYDKVNISCDVFNHKNGCSVRCVRN